MIQNSSCENFFNIYKKTPVRSLNNKYWGSTPTFLLKRSLRCFFFTCEFLIPQCRIFRSSRLLFIKKASWKISQHSEKNTFAGVSLLKKRLWRRCFPVNFAKFFKLAFSQNIFGWLLLSFSEIWTSAHISCGHFFRCQSTHTYLPKTVTYLRIMPSKRNSNKKRQQQKLLNFLQFYCFHEITFLISIYLFIRKFSW